MAEENDKPFNCSFCDQKFVNNDRLSVHTERHMLTLKLTLRADSVSDQTPTPTRFLKNCEDVGLFNELQVTSNPFDDEFKRAAASVSQDRGISPPPHTTQTPSVIVVQSDMTRGDTTNIVTPTTGQSVMSLPLNDPVISSVPIECVTITTTTTPATEHLHIIQNPVTKANLRSAHTKLGPSPLTFQQPSLKPTTVAPQKTSVTLSHQPSVTLTHTNQPSVTLTHTHQPSVTLIHQPSVTLTHQPSVTLTHQPSVTLSHTHQPSVTLSHTHQPSVTLTHTNQPSVTLTHTNQPSVTLLHQPSVTLTHQPSVTLTHQPSVTLTHQPSFHISTKHQTNTASLNTRQTRNSSGTIPMIIELPSGESIPITVPASPTITVPSSPTLTVNNDNSFSNIEPSTVTALPPASSVHTVPCNTVFTSDRNRNSTGRSNDVNTAKQRLKAAIKMNYENQGIPVPSLQSVQTKPKQRSRLRSDDMDEKRQRFLERNRAAASRCRRKRKMWVNQLEDKATDYQQVNAQLVKEVACLKGEIAELKQLLLAHKDCPVTRGQMELHTTLLNTPVSSNNMETNTGLPLATLMSSVHQSSTILHINPSQSDAPDSTTMTDAAK